MPALQKSVLHRTALSSKEVPLLLSYRPCHRVHYSWPCGRDLEAGAEVWWDLCLLGTCHAAYTCLHGAGHLLGLHASQPACAKFFLSSLHLSYKLTWQRAEEELRSHVRPSLSSSKHILNDMTLAPTCLCSTAVFRPSGLQGYYVDL